MNLRDLANLIPKKYRFSIKLRINAFRRIIQIKLLPKKKPEYFMKFLIERLHLSENRDVLVHSSYDALLYWNLTPEQIVNTILEVIGKEGTLIMPTFSRTISKDFIESRATFDVSKTHTQMGLLNEIFRRMPGVVRSMDPLKSFAAYGPKASYYTDSHHLSVFSYDKESPLFKLAENDGIVIGLGVPSHNNTIVHTIESIMGDRFPLEVYDNDFFDINVKTYDSEIITVRKKLLKEDRPDMNIEKFSKHFNSGDFYQFTYYLSPYFYCQAKPFLKHGTELARDGITIYN